MRLKQFVRNMVQQSLKMLQNLWEQLTKVYKLELLVHIMQFPLMEIKLLQVLQEECFLQIAKMQQIRFVNGLHRPERMHRGISMKNLAITTE